MTLAAKLVADYFSIPPRNRTGRSVSLMTQMINDALEEAANVCEDEFRVHVSEGCSCSGAEDCAERIRTLKEASL